MQALERLNIIGDIVFGQHEHLLSFFRGIAAAPKLRTLSLRLRGPTPSGIVLSEMFAKALQDCKNKSLESVDYLRCDNTNPNKPIWNDTFRRNRILCMYTVDAILEKQLFINY
jgi:hypothetical protein